MGWKEAARLAREAADKPAGVPMGGSEVAKSEPDIKPYERIVVVTTNEVEPAKKIVDKVESVKKVFAEPKDTKRKYVRRNDKR